MKRYCLALNLRSDPILHKEYIEHHANVPIEVQMSILESGITNMQIYKLGDQLFMIMDTSDDFSFEKKAEMDASNEHVQKWEDLMSKFQNVSVGSDPYAKWQLMENIFDLK